MNEVSVVGFPTRHFSTETLFCDCQLKWLLLWARGNSVRIGNDTVCMFPTHLHGLEFRNLREHQLRCGTDYIEPTLLCSVLTTINRCKYTHLHLSVLIFNLY